MNRLSNSQREAADLGVSFAIALLFCVLNFIVNFPEVVDAVFSNSDSIPALTLIINALFIWIAILLVAAFIRWRKAAVARRDLTDVVSSISPDTLMVLDETEKVIYCNNSVLRMFGVSRKEACGKNLSEFLSYDFTNGHHETAVMESMSRDGFLFATATGRRIDGEEFPLEIISGDVTSKMWKVYLLRDTTYRKKNEERRRNAEQRVHAHERLKSLGVLTGGIAHDFNNLLMTITGNIELAAVNSGSKDIQMQQLNDALSAAGKAGHLCQDMLTYSGSLQIAERPVDIDTLLDQLALFAETSVPEKVNITFDRKDDLPMIKGSLGHIEHMLSNVVMNACEAVGDAGGNVSVSSGLRTLGEEDCAREVLLPIKAGEYVYISVKDDGPGMTKDVVSHIFEPFFSTKFTGRGLGLAAAHGIMSAHNGSIFVDSKPGEGSEFTMLFPVCTNAAADPSAPKVMLIMSDTTEAASVSKTLLPYNICTITAGNLSSALNIITKHGDEITAAAVDLKESGMSYGEIISELRAVSKRAFLLIAVDSDDSVKRELPGIAFIKRPYIISDLAGRLASEVSEKE